MTYRVTVDTCQKCGGSGWQETSETNDQYGRTHQTYDVCRECGGEGEVIVEEED